LIEAIINVEIWNKNREKNSHENYLSMSQGGKPLVDSSYSERSYIFERAAGASGSPSGDLTLLHLIHESHV